jgi:hypothetical protein
MTRACFCAAVGLLVLASCDASSSAPATTGSEASISPATTGTATASSTAGPASTISTEAAPVTEATAVETTTIVPTLLGVDTVTPSAQNEPDPNGGTLITLDGRGYMCFAKASGSDVNCKRYYGGDVSRPFFGSQDLWCTERSFSECTEAGYYPSDLDGFDVMTIDGQRVLCQFGRCWLWPDYVKDPSGVPFGPPDYECGSIPGVKRAVVIRRCLLPQAEPVAPSSRSSDR